ncbi:MAG: hypothetical protein R3C97_07125 [Geminicoccaceae bacterium]
MGQSEDLSAQRARAARLLEAGDALFCASRAAAITLAVASLLDGGGGRGRRRPVVMLAAHDRFHGATTSALLRLAGARVITVGSVDRAERHEVETALDAPGTAGIHVDACPPAGSGSYPAAHELIFAARRRGLPAVVHVPDAARAVAILDAGAALVTLGVDGAAGIIAGTAGAVARCAGLFDGMGAAMTAHRCGIDEALAVLARDAPNPESPRPIPLRSTTWRAGGNGELLGPFESDG